MPLSTTEHLTATCVVMFIAALGAGYLPTLVKVMLLLPTMQCHNPARQCTQKKPQTNEIVDDGDQL